MNNYERDEQPEDPVLSLATMEQICYELRKRHDTVVLATEVKRSENPDKSHTHRFQDYWCGGTFAAYGLLVGYTQRFKREHIINDVGEEEDEEC